MTPEGGEVPSERPLGTVLVEEGLVTPEQLEEALTVQGTLATYVPIGQILIDRKVITRQQLLDVLKRQKKRLLLGQILVRTRAITEERLRGALSYQRKVGIRLGDALIQLGLVTETQLRQALCSQLNIPFVDLENYSPDPKVGLAELIPKAYAVTHRVVPIARVGESLTLVMDDPTDAAVVKEVGAMTRCSVNVVTAWRAGLERALRRTYGSDAMRTAESWRQSRPDDRMP